MRAHKRRKKKKKEGKIKKRRKKRRQRRKSFSWRPGERSKEELERQV